MTKPEKKSGTLRKLAGLFSNKKDRPEGAASRKSRPEDGDVSNDEGMRKSHTGQVSVAHMTRSMGGRSQGIARQSSLLSESDGAAGSPEKKSSRTGWSPQSLELSGRRRSRSFLVEPGSSGDSTPRSSEPMSTQEQALLWIPAQWKFGDKIGSGSFGSVWRAQFKPNGHTYAVKKIKQAGGEVMEETEREVKLMSQLDHRHVVRYYGGSLVGNGTFFWIVMEFMECGTLCDLMRLSGGPLVEAVVATVLRDVTAGLAYLHDMGVFHKDIKSENILVSGGAVAKLADFGVSQKQRQLGSGDTVQHQGGGTLCFMAPEVIRGAVCAKSDVWSLGITIIEMLNGCSPFETLPQLQLAEAILQEPGPRLDASLFSEEACHAVAMCLMHELSERASLSAVIRSAFVAYAPPREKAMVPLVQEVLKRKQELELEQETARRRALVGGGSVKLN